MDMEVWETPTTPHCPVCGATPRNLKAPDRDTSCPNKRCCLFSIPISKEMWIGRVGKRKITNRPMRKCEMT